jgi:hypothetical protein
MSNQISPKGVGVDFCRSTYKKIEPALSQKTVTIFVEIQTPSHRWEVTWSKDGEVKITKLLLGKSIRTKPR